MKKLVVILVLCASMAWGYEYESSIDPVDFFRHYYPIKVEQYSPIEAMAIVSSDRMKPEFAVNFLVRRGSRVMIIGYCYIEDGEFKWYSLVGSNYILKESPDDIKETLTKALKEAMDAKKKKEQEEKETGTETEKPSIPTPKGNITNC